MIQGFGVWQEKYDRAANEKEAVDCCVELEWANYLAFNQIQPTFLQAQQHGTPDLSGTYCAMNLRFEVKHVWGGKEDDQRMASTSEAISIGQDHRGFIDRLVKANNQFQRNQYNILVIATESVAVGYLGIVGVLDKLSRADDMPISKIAAVLLYERWGYTVDQKLTKFRCLQNLSAERPLPDSLVEKLSNLEWLLPEEKQKKLRHHEEVAEVMKRLIDEGIAARSLAASTAVSD